MLGPPHCYFLPALAGAFAGALAAGFAATLAAGFAAGFAAGAAFFAAGAGAGAFFTATGAAFGAAFLAGAFEAAAATAGFLAGAFAATGAILDVVFSLFRMEALSVRILVSVVDNQFNSLVLRDSRKPSQRNCTENEFVQNFIHQTVPFSTILVAEITAARTLGSFRSRTSIVSRMKSAFGLCDGVKELSLHSRQLESICEFSSPDS
jgi:hypothetical protein